jgi:hypothetical protein
VASFVTKALIALGTWLGVATLDLGAQASAAFLAVASLTPQIDENARGPDMSGPADPGRDWCTCPEPARDRPPVHWAHTGAENPSSGGAGASSGSSSTANPGACNSAAAVRPARPNLVTRLHRPEATSLSVLLTAAIFEPPRSGG